MPNEQQIHEECVVHMAMEEKNKSVTGRLTMLMWMIGFLIAAVLTTSSALYSSLTSLNREISGYTARFVTIERDYRSMVDDVRTLRIEVDALKQRVNDSK